MSELDLPVGSLYSVRIKVGIAPMCEALSPMPLTE